MRVSAESFVPAVEVDIEIAVLKFVVRIEDGKDNAFLVLRPCPSDERFAKVIYRRFYETFC